MKILIIGDTYFRSSTGQIAYLHAHELVRRGHECKVVVGFCPEEHNSECVVTENKAEWALHYCFSLVTGYEGRFSPISTYKIKKVIEDYQPDIIQLFNLHGYYVNQYVLLQYIAQKKIKTVYSMLDEYPYLGHCCYAYTCSEYKYECKNCNLVKSEYIKTLFFRRGYETLKLKEKAYGMFEDITFTGPKWVLKRAKESALLRERHLVEIDECIDLDQVFYPKDSSMLKKQLQIPEDKKVILNVCVASNPRKGYIFYQKIAQMMENRDEYVFVHVGYDLKEQKLPFNMIVINYINRPTELATFFSMADLFVCTSLADTMPNTCLNALACGTKVCGFEVTGIPYVADETCGKFVKAGDVEAMKEIICSINKKDSEAVNTCREYALKRYSPQVFTEKLLKVYES